MSSQGKSGQGTTIAFATSGFTAKMHMIGGTERSRESLEDSDLSLPVNSERTNVPGDLLQVSTFDIRYEWDQSFSTQPPITAPPETITITYPLKPGESTPATWAGTGYMSREKGPDIETNTSKVMEGEATITWDGKTGPVYTAGSA